jgi:hypothetical protein
VNFLTDLLERRFTLRLADVLVYGWVGEKYACVNFIEVFPLVVLTTRDFTVGQTTSKLLLAKWQNVKERRVLTINIKVSTSYIICI